jgi:hypothetical protein
MATAAEMVYDPLNLVPGMKTLGAVAPLVGKTAKSVVADVPRTSAKILSALPSPDRPFYSEMDMRIANMGPQPRTKDQARAELSKNARANEVARLDNALAMIDGDKVTSAELLNALSERQSPGSYQVNINPYLGHWEGDNIPWATMDNPFIGVMVDDTGGTITLNSSEGLNPFYRGQHDFSEDEIAFARYTPISPYKFEGGETRGSWKQENDNPGIYVHELQSDLMDDLRKSGVKKEFFTEEDRRIFQDYEKKLSEVNTNIEQADRDIDITRNEISILQSGLKDVLNNNVEKLVNDPDSFLKPEYFVGGEEALFYYKNTLRKIKPFYDLDPREKLNNMRRQSIIYDLDDASVTLEGGEKIVRDIEETITALENMKIDYDDYFRDKTDVDLYNNDLDVAIEDLKWAIYPIEFLKEMNRPISKSDVGRVSDRYEKGLKNANAVLSQDLYNIFRKHHSPDVTINPFNSYLEAEEKIVKIKSRLHDMRLKRANLTDEMQNIRREKDNLSGGSYYEAFPGMAENSKASQQLMMKMAVNAAQQMDKKFVAFPGAESAQAQLYVNNIPRNGKDVVKDLGPGYELKKVTLKGKEGYFDTWAIAWDEEAKKNTMTKGIRFAEGGPVSKVDQMMEEEMVRPTLPKDNLRQTESRGMLSRLTQSPLRWQLQNADIAETAKNYKPSLVDDPLLSPEAQRQLMVEQQGSAIEPVDPTLSDSLYNFLYDVFSRDGNKSAAMRRARMGQRVMEWTPAEGVADYQRAKQKYAEGDFAGGNVDMALAMSTLIPGNERPIVEAASDTTKFLKNKLDNVVNKIDNVGDEAVTAPLPETESGKMLDELDLIGVSPLLSETEARNINKSVGRNKDKQERAQQTAIEFKQKYSPTDGWAPTEINSIKVKKSGMEVKPKKIPYGFHIPPVDMDEIAWAASISDGIVSEVNKIIDRAQAGDQAAIAIISQANWYRAMRDRLRSEFGSMGDVFADVLGATSAQTNVEQNFNNAIEIMRKYSRGDYDNELEALTRRIESGESIDPKLLTQLHKSGEFPLITKDSGALFNSNSPAAMGALLNMFRTIKAGRAPKTPNFTGNLIGLTDEATIDVWAARMLRRLSGRDRIPPAAESAVAGSHLVDSTLMEPKVGSEFGFGQKVFRDAATKINNEGRLQEAFPEVGNVGPDDLQAVAWFIEKENWAKNGWTTKAGEGGSLDYEMSLAGAPDQARVSELRRGINKGFKAPARRKTESDADYEARVQVARDEFNLARETMQAELSMMEAPLQRYQIGISGERPNKPMSNYAQAELAAELDDAVRNDPTVRVYGITNAYGSFEGKIERSLNAEFIVDQNFDPQALRRRMLEQAKAYDQDAVFLSKIVPPGTENARPGVEIYYKEGVTREQLDKTAKKLRESGIDGFTYATDMRFNERVNRQTRSGDPETATLKGLRFQYVPEFDDTFDAAKSAEKYREMADLYNEILRDIISEGNVSDARLVYYDTEVVFRDQYDDLLRERTRKSDTETGQGLSAGSVSAEADSGRKGTGQELPEPVPDRSGKGSKIIVRDNRGKIIYETYGSNLADAKQKLGITEDQVTAYRSANKGTKQKPLPEVQDAAKKLQNGEITTEEYLKVVEDKMPIIPIGKVPNRPSVEEIAMSLKKNDMTSAGIVGVNIDIPDGTMISSRLDIPAYEGYDTWVVTLHDGTVKNGNAIGYGQTAVLDNVTFTLNGTANGPLKMATGEANKGTVARINGAWKNMDPAEVEQMAKSILDGTAPDADEWVEVGMNPFRHSYFYRKSDGMPVADAEQVIQVGPLVLAKKAKTRPIESPEHLIDPGPPPRYFKRGGNVERVYNDRRYI